MREAESADAVGGVLIAAWSCRASGIVSHGSWHALHLLARAIARFFRAPSKHAEREGRAGIVVAAVGCSDERIDKCGWVGCGGSLRGCGAHHQDQQTRRPRGSAVYQTELVHHDSCQDQRAEESPPPWWHCRGRRKFGRGRRSLLISEERISWPGGSSPSSVQYFAVELEEDRGIRLGHGDFEDENLVVLAGLADVEAAVLGSRCPQD